MRFSVVLVLCALLAPLAVSEHADLDCSNPSCLIGTVPVPAAFVDPAYTADGSTVYSTHGGNLRGIDISSTQAIWSQPVPGSVHQLGLSADETRLFYAGTSGDIATTGAVDASSGEVVWSHTLTVTGQAPPCERSSGKGVAPSLDGSRAFSAAWVRYLPAYYPQGCSPPDPYVNQDLVIMAFDTATGVAAWSARWAPPEADWQEIPGRVEMSVVAGTLVVAASWKHPEADIVIRGYDVSNGLLLWTTQFEHGSIAAPLHVAGTSFLVVTDGGDHGLVAKVSSLDGGVIWERELSSHPASFEVSPFDGDAYVVGRSNTKRIVTERFEVETGDRVWQVAFRPPDYAMYYADIAFLDGGDLVAYAIDYTHDTWTDSQFVAVLAAWDGSMQWNAAVYEAPVGILVPSADGVVSAWTHENTGWNLRIHQPPTAPLGLTITGNSASSATLSWSPPEYTGGRDVIEYRIYRSVQYGQYMHLANVPGDVTSWTDSSFQPGHAHYYYVEARNVAGVGHPSSVQCHDSIPLVWSDC